MHDIILQSFRKRLTLNGVLTSVENWHTVIVENSELWDVLLFGTNYEKVCKDKSVVIFYFFRNAFEHLLKDNESGHVNDIRKMLYEIFSDVSKDALLVCTRVLAASRDS